MSALLFACSKPPAPAPPPATQPPTELRRLTVAGLNAYEQGATAEALANFAKAAQAQPNQFEAQLNLANAQLRADAPEPAIVAAKAALHLNKDSAAAHYIAGCAHLRLIQPVEAVKALQLSIQLAPEVAAAHFQLGHAHLALVQNEPAAAAFQETVRLDPQHRAAHYGLSQVLARLGQPEAAQAALTRHQEISGGTPLVTQPSFFERCVHTQPLLPAIEAEEPAAQGVAVTFSDATEAMLGGVNFRGPAGIIDPSHDFRHGILARDDAGFRLLLNQGGKLVVSGEPLPALPDAKYARTLIGDLNNDGFEDAVLLSDKGAQVFAFTKDGGARDVSRGARLSTLTARDGVLVDLDFTGKLGLAAITADGALKMLRNEGTIRFSDITASLALPPELAGANAVTFDDWDGDDRLDLFVTRPDKPPFLLGNRPRGATTGPVAPAHWPAADAVAVGDLDNDFHTDLVAASAAGIEALYGGGERRARLGDAIPGVKLALFDYDNDGWLDAFAISEAGLRAWRNLGRAGFRETTADLALNGLALGGVTSMQTADFDADGDSDLLLELTTGALRLLRNDGANANAQLKLRLPGKRSNASGIGARIELRDGGWKTIRTARTLPIEIGTGAHAQVGIVRLHWSDLVTNAGSATASPKDPLTLVEMELPTGSCPNLYAWDGQRFRFITDFLGAAPAGLPLNAERFVEADTEELILIGTDAAFPPREGAFAIAVTSELREVLYLDEAKLLVVDHPPGSEVHSTSKLRPGKPFPPPALVTLGARREMVKATRSDSADVTAALSEIDRAMCSPVALRVPQLRGLAEPWSVTLEFKETVPSSLEPLSDEASGATLALTGWLRFGGGMANVAGAHDPELPFPFPMLEVETAPDRWEKVDVLVGAPDGKTKTILVDLAGKLPAGARRLRLSTAFEIHWDRIALFERAAAASQPVALSPATADLRWHGFGEYQPLPADQPLTPNHDRVRHQAPWLIAPSGWCTRYGDARPLISERDDALAILNGGDRLELRFPTAALPPKPAGWTRSLFFFSSGWDKDSDHHIAHGWTVEPLPFHGMDDQRYGAELRPPGRRDELMRQLNTRWVGPLMLSRER